PARLHAGPGPGRAAHRPGPDVRSPRQYAAEPPRRQRRPGRDGGPGGPSGRDPLAIREPVRRRVLGRRADHRAAAVLAPNDPATQRILLIPVAAGEVTYTASPAVFSSPLRRPPPRFVRRVECASGPPVPATICPIELLDRRVTPTIFRAVLRLVP